MTRDQLVGLALVWLCLGGTVLMFGIAAAKDVLDRAPWGKDR